MPSGRLPVDPLSRLHSKYLKVESGCWEWTGYCDKDGYGKFPNNGWDHSQMAHRASYQLLTGAIPSGMTLDHLCSNRKCVNPDHLEPVTQSENVRRAAAKGSYKWSAA